ncbi:MAG: glycosyltransferase, partial [Gemmatimonadetes bacterium]|nr:glycosyltransferase [Gemmatimonadota bacterium]
FPKHPLIAHYHMTYLDPEQTAEAEVLSGSCMMVRKAAMDQVGLLDEDYFMYGEDIDWCYRFHQAGWKIYYVPTTSIIHFRGESGRGVPLRILYRKSWCLLSTASSKSAISSASTSSRRAGWCRLRIQICNGLLCTVLQLWSGCWRFTRRACTTAAATRWRGR